ncbi:MAG: hypothetical protein ACJA09_003490 [Alcanivorax sp.]|jgi:hypothetical protein
METTIVNLYHQTVPVFSHQLKNLAAILKLAAKDAKARSIDPSVLLNSRLAPDMLPLVSQVRIATDHAKGCCSRLADVDAPYLADDETTFAELDQRIKIVLKFLRTLKPAQFEGAENHEITMVIPIGTLGFSGLDYFNGWSMPNFYFHYTTAFAILRDNGLSIGKQEFLGQVPGMTGKGKVAKMMGLKPLAKNVKK